MLLEQGHYDSHNQNDRYNTVALSPFCGHGKNMHAVCRVGLTIWDGLSSHTNYTYFSTACTLHILADIYLLILLNYNYFLNRNLLAFVFIPVIQREMDIFRETVWNSHRVRSQ
jgi:hypothetical protein